MATVDMVYYVSFGKGDSGEYTDWEYELEDEYEELYLWAKKMRLDLNRIPRLRDALDEAAEEIAESEIEIGIENGDEYVLECLGRTPVDPDEINALVWDGDEYALKYFGLSGMEEDELEEWDANELDELPDVCDFDPDFEPVSPFEEDWNLTVLFAEHPEDEPIDGEEAEEILRGLLREADGCYDELNSFISRCSRLYSGSGTLYSLASRLAAENGNGTYRE